ncbi:Crp/Fnr family transcriptional regulator [Nonomuraea dietziae]|uniref:Crp/Fnr family transcriptional regulator n=1 Tax=Nonomuraea dietziae TaxID=65515 RepID=UPI003446ED84
MAVWTRRAPGGRRWPACPHRAREAGLQCGRGRGGQAKVTAHAARQQTLQTLLAIRSPGQLLGENEALQRGGTTIRRATVQAVENAVVLMVDAKTFKAFLNAHPPAWEALARKISNRLLETEARVGGMAAEAANRRLARALGSLLDHERVVRDGFSPVMLQLS